MTTIDSDKTLSDIRHWLGLVRTGAWAALASVVLIGVQIAVYLIWPPPDSAEDFFRVLAENPIAGLLMLDLLYPLSNILTLLLYAALGVALWRVSRSAVAIALALGGIGMAAYMASLRPVEMLHLARAYSEAEPGERAALLATGEGMLATWTGTAFDVYYLLNFATLLIFGILIYRSTVFGRATAVWGLAAAAFMAVPSNVGTVGLVFALTSLLPWSVFAVLTARRLLALCREAAPPGLRPGTRPLTLPRTTPD
ncbi:DUF4386 family protein [Dietzia natronolimnaea]|uniref:DUF4386 family protein n=1 Tax=Dietzia natronolimnaea TaxID=161920 RepID=UPI0015F94A7A|nr:DUF4386 family protein [Dietzia natronolimnaea]MBB1038316.1 DUF4386 family protein [Dietzia natronolimnaea]